MKAGVVGIIGITLALLAVCAWACPGWIWIQSPGDGGVELMATATVEAGVEIVEEGYTAASVEFFVDDESIGTDDASPFSVSWDTSKVANGEHKLRAVGTLLAKDKDGTEVKTNIESETVTVEVKNPEKEEPPTDETE